jgi:hypothetical protein
VVRIGSTATALGELTTGSSPTTRVSTQTVPTAANAPKASTPPRMARGQVSMRSGVARVAEGRAAPASSFARSPRCTIAVTVTTASPISSKRSAAGKNQAGRPSLSMKTSVTSRMAQDVPA